MADVVSLDEVKDHLGKTTDGDDGELMEYVEAATSIVEKYIGPVVAQAFIERHSSGRRFVLRRTPILSVTSVVPWLATGATYAVVDLVLDADTGVVERSNGMPFISGPFRVTYQAGRTVVPPNARLAALIIIGHLWETQRGRSKITLGGNSDVVPVPGMSYAVPKRALELLGGPPVMVG